MKPWRYDEQQRIQIIPRRPLAPQPVRTTNRDQR